MFVYNKQKSRIDNAETSRSKYEENITSKNESKYRIEKHRIQSYNQSRKSKRDEVNSIWKSDEIMRSEKSDEEYRANINE